MKKIFTRVIALTLVALTLLFLMTSCSVSKGYKGAPPNMRPCNEGDEGFGMIMYVPDYWEVETSTGIPTATYPDSNDKATITLTRVPAAEYGGDFDAYWNKYLELFKTSVQEFNLLTVKQPEEGEPAPEDPIPEPELFYINETSFIRIHKYEFKITFQNNKVDYCVDQAFIVHPTSGDLLMITYTNQKPAYKKHLTDLKNVYKNIKFVTEPIRMEDKVEKPVFSTVKDTPEGFSAITREELNYVLFVPSTWTPTINTGTSAACDLTEGSSAYCVISELTLAANNTYEGYISLLERDLKETFGNVTFADPEKKIEPIVVGKREFRKCVYTVNAYGTEYTYEHYIRIDGGTIFLITLSCESNEYEQHKDTFSAIVSNFKYKK